MKRIAMLVSFIILSFCITAIPVGSAYAASQTVAPKFTPVTGALMNNPQGTVAQQAIIMSTLMKTIDATPKGSLIRVAVFSIWDQPVTNHLVSAYKRGVNVRVLVDDHITNDQTALLKKTLGTNMANPSYFFMCKGSCMYTSGMMHAKFITILNSGTAHHVVMSGSDNITPSGQNVGWNNYFTVVNNVPLYNSFRDYFNDMLKDKNMADYSKGVTTGPYTSFFYPSAETHIPKDIIYEAMKGIQCTGVPAGHGTADHRTLVRLSVAAWSHTRNNIASAIWNLTNAGCKVQVILNTGTTEASTFAALFKAGGKHGTVEIYNAQLDTTGDGKPDYYNHNKVLAISGLRYGKIVDEVMTSSMNLQAAPERYDNEQTLTIEGRTVFNQYNATFSLQLGHGYTKPVKTMPKTTSSMSSDTPTDPGNDFDDENIFD